MAEGQGKRSADAGKDESPALRRRRDEAAVRLNARCTERLAAPEREGVPGRLRGDVEGPGLRPSGQDPPGRPPSPRRVRAESPPDVDPPVQMQPVAQPGRFERFGELDLGALADRIRTRDMIQVGHEFESPQLGPHGEIVPAVPTGFEEFVRTRIEGLAVAPRRFQLRVRTVQFDEPAEASRSFEVCCKAGMPEQWLVAARFRVEQSQGKAVLQLDWVDVDSGVDFEVGLREEGHRHPGVAILRSSEFASIWKRDKRTVRFCGGRCPAAEAVIEICPLE